MTAARPLTLDMAKLAVEHVGVLAMVGETTAATMVEAELKDRFIEAVAAATCEAPHAVAVLLRGLKALDFPRALDGDGRCYQLDAILGPSGDLAVKKDAAAP